MIASKINNKTAVQCLHRWNKILKPGLIKGPWTIEEDRKLLEWIKNNGAEKWTSASEFIVGRSGKQCRERWFNTLNPDVKKGGWTPEEDFLIFKIFAEYGSKWSLIASKFPGRTENSVKNRFYSTLRRISLDKKKLQATKQQKHSELEDINDNNIEDDENNNKSNTNNIQDLMKYLPQAFAEKTKLFLKYKKEKDALYKDISINNNNINSSNHEIFNLGLDKSTNNDLKNSSFDDKNLKINNSEKNASEFVENKNLEEDQIYENDQDSKKMKSYYSSNPFKNFDISQNSINDSKDDFIGLKIKRDFDTSQNNISFKKRKISNSLISLNYSDVKNQKKNSSKNILTVNSNDSNNISNIENNSFIKTESKENSQCDKILEDLKYINNNSFEYKKNERDIEKITREITKFKNSNDDNSKFDMNMNMTINNDLGLKNIDFNKNQNNKNDNYSIKSKNKSEDKKDTSKIDNLTDLYDQLNNLEGILLNTKNQLFKLDRIFTKESHNELSSINQHSDIMNESNSNCISEINLNLSNNQENPNGDNIFDHYNKSKKNYSRKSDNSSKIISKKNIINSENNEKKEKNYQNNLNLNKIKSDDGNEIININNNNNNDKLSKNIKNNNTESFNNSLINNSNSLLNDNEKQNKFIDSVFQL